VAAATGKDALALRLALLKAPREIAVLKAAAEQAGWGEPDTKPRPAVADTLRGRDISLMSGYNAHVAVIAEVEIDRPTGRVWPRAVANAIYNATGKRIRRFPMTAARVKQALAG
jgi:CO/xanthine dehydrogenase Mo-binding subunit